MTPYLSTPSKLGILQSEAGSRAQSDGSYGLTLALTGSVQGETEPKKATQSKAGHNIKTPDFVRDKTPSMLVQQATRTRGSNG
ncbi:hypothetical protein DP113_34740 (plasmid) [Brasilonema octagenarum UFV-E1]|uniref:Uncharacterized protein n=2 Tax=Brasilonema TaxID=383614 RepID=A0A856MAN0_9CYAN|nr:hypothetical protein [Brasilonema octagenarum UFV-OR1]QDL07099.1 hypothetical protein DP114_03520 [Brasilonema sennae CENA114]QDL13463.1 hypothetical protein DP113_03475 [Brasilonema octagenarum UFV-E1]QDL07508.1 hypothetical protein DP114_05990 [Brasilonema sennae CENA114]QDL09792.1 hypothetical protein DP114_19545 [Brasilonema sennae CENA114]